MFLKYNSHISKWIMIWVDNLMYYPLNNQVGLCILKKSMLKIINQLFNKKKLSNFDDDDFLLFTAIIQKISSSSFPINKHFCFILWDLLKAIAFSDFCNFMLLLTLCFVWFCWGHFIKCNEPGNNPNDRRKCPIFLFQFFGN